MNIRELKHRVAELHRDDDGEIPVGPILVIALVVIPLGLLLMTFGEELFTWFNAKWTNVKSKSP